MDTKNSIDQGDKITDAEGSFNPGLYLGLYSSLVEDIADACSLPQSEVKRDLEEIRYRCTKEGFSFLTKALPMLGKALDRALSGVEPFACPLTFRMERGWRTPELFRCLWRMVFDEVGELRVLSHDSSKEPFGQLVVASVRALRQLLYYLYKIEMRVPEVLAEQTLAAWERVDGELSEFCIIPSDFLDRSAKLLNNVFWKFDPRDIVPRHGPGAVATGENNHEKHCFSRIYMAIERVYPFTDYYVYSLADVCDNYHRYGELQVESTGTTKVVLVPKDSRAPRVISCEPLEYQWIQQGLGRAIMAWLERHPLTKGHVNFTDQGINRRLALESSADQRWVTLDMKEASDRVGMDLVQNLFCRLLPDLYDALQATRSPCAMLPSGRTIRMNKFATMGSCLCFPVQSIVFYVLAVSAIRMVYGLKRRKALEAVYVFGDDIIVDRRYHTALLQLLPTVGLRFNESKCCTEGFFRESCGCDAYHGVDVTPLRLKKVWCHQRVDADACEAFLRHSNMAYARGFSRLATLASGLVESKTGSLPLVPMDGGEVGYFALRRPVRALQPGSNRMRYNRTLQRWEIRGWTSHAPSVGVECDAWSMVLRRQKVSKPIQVDDDGNSVGFRWEKFPMPVPKDELDNGVFALSRSNCLRRGWTAA